MADLGLPMVRVSPRNTNPGTWRRSGSARVRGGSRRRLFLPVLLGEAPGLSGTVAGGRRLLGGGGDERSCHGDLGSVVETHLVKEEHKSRSDEGWKQGGHADN